MLHLSSEDLAAVTNNPYEAVIIASQRARHLNVRRLALLQRMEDSGEPIEIDGRKITMVALKDLVDGKVKFERPESM